MDTPLVCMNLLSKPRGVCLQKKKKSQFCGGVILTGSFPIFFCSRVCHWTACMTMASHLLSRFTMISCMGWWSAFRLQVSRSSRRCWHSRRMEATPLRRCLISWQRDCNIEGDQFVCVRRTGFLETWGNHFRHNFTLQGHAQLRTLGREGTYRSLEIGGLQYTADEC